MRNFIVTAPREQQLWWASCDLCHQRCPASHQASKEKAIEVAKRLGWEVKEAEVIGQGKQVVFICPRCQQK